MMHGMDIFDFKEAKRKTKFSIKSLQMNVHDQYLLVYIQKEKVIE